MQRRLKLTSSSLSWPPMRAMMVSGFTTPSRQWLSLSTDSFGLHQRNF